MLSIEKIFNNYLILSGQIEIIFIIVPITLGIIKWKLHSKALRILWWYCVVTLLLNVGEQVFILLVRNKNFQPYILPTLLKYEIKNTSFLSILYFTKNFILLSWFYIELLKKDFNLSWVKYVIVILLIGLWTNHLFIEGFKGYGVINRSFDAIFCFCLPLLYSHFLFKDTNLVPLRKNPYFWINIGLISTALLAFYLFLAGNKIKATDNILFFKLAILKNIIAMIEQLLITVGFYYARYTKYLLQYTPSV